MRDRQHLLIPDCANDLAKLDEMLAVLSAAKYDMHAMCMWAPLAETRARGEPRALREGKLWTPKMYGPSVKGSWAMAQRFAQALERQLEVQQPSATPSGPRAGSEGGAAAFRSLSLWDNTVFPAAPVSLPEFGRLSTMSIKEGEAHAERLKRCAACYMSADAADAATGLSDLGVVSEPVAGGPQPPGGHKRSSSQGEGESALLWQGRGQGCVLGAVMGAIGGGSAVALHGPLAGAAASCSIL